VTNAAKMMNRLISTAENRSCAVSLMYNTGQQLLKNSSHDLNYSLTMQRFDWFSHHANVSCAVRVNRPIITSSNGSDTYKHCVL